MESRTRTASPTPISVDVKQDSPPLVQDKISAYYSLVFPHFTFYIQTLSVTIGRRCAPTPSAATSSTSETVQVDVDLGALKSVSRLHAKIEYDQEEDRFVLAVVGRNGAWVDGVWSGSGTRAPLGERSQIQIASRIFHFVLPPPPPPEDTPSPSSQSSANRPRSPSVDITSISPPSSQPSHSPIPSGMIKLAPPSPEPQLPPKPQPQLPNSNSIGKYNKSTSKKRKKGEAQMPVLERPKPEDMPPKPPFTYAQLIFRAIKAIGGKATLQEICSWIMNTHEYYRYADGAWMSSVRHNLSSGRAFMKMERCGGDRGKGFFWSVDEKFAQTLEEQETKSQQAAAQGGGTGGKDSAKVRKKDKGASLLEPPLKRSIKGDLKGSPLPPPLTTLPLPLKSVTSPTTTTSSGSGTGAFGSVPTTTQTTTGSYFAQPPPAQLVSESHTAISAYSGKPLNTSNPYAALTQSHWNINASFNINSSATPATLPPSTTTFVVTAPANVASQTSLTSQPQSLQSPAAQPSQSSPQIPPGGTPVPDVVIPIILGPIPSTHPDYSPNHPNNSAKEGYMVLHERKLILDPNVFAGLTKEMLQELEKMGARSALVVLTGHMVRALKERRARERGKDRGARRTRGTGRGSATRKATTAAVGTPFTNAPLEHRKLAGHAGTLNKPSSSLTPALSLDPKPPALVPTPISDPLPNPPIQEAASVDPGSPFVVVDDSDDDGPATKRRRVEEVGEVIYPS